MSLPLLFTDELRGFYRSKVMMFLWIGLPVVSVLFNLLSPDVGDEIPFSVVSALLVSSIGGTLSSAMLAVDIINEKNEHVFDLFVIRPVKRGYLLLSKFLAVYMCVVIASLLALAIGLGIDVQQDNMGPEMILEVVSEMFIISMSMVAISASAGILIGVVSPSVLVGVILVIYLGNQLSAVPLLPTTLDISNRLGFTVLLGVVITISMLWISTLIFSRRQF